MLFTILIGTTETVYGQFITRDTTGIFYTDKQDMRCLECLVNAPKKDSIISTQYNFIQFQDTTIVKMNLDLVELQRKSKRNLKVGLAVGGVTGFFIRLFLVSLMK